MSKKHTPSFPRSCVGMQTETNPSQGMGSHAGAWEPEKTLVPKLRFPEFRDAEEWDKNSFGGAATFINGRAYKQKELLDKGKYRVLRVGNFFSNKEWYYSNLELEENKYCDDGDLLYAWSASFGPKIWKGEKVIYHYHIWKVVENKGINKDFLFILLEFETERMKAQSANGLGLLHITKGTIEDWKCYIPKPQEQQKIADCLSSIDDLITAQAQKTEALKAHKKGLMQQLFPREGETVPRIRFPEFRNTVEWEEKQVKNIAPLQRGFDLPTDKIKTGNVPIVYSNGVRNFHDIGMAKGPGLVTGRSGTIGKIHYIEEGDYWPHNTSLWVTNFKGNIPKFIYYLYKSIGIIRFASGSGVPTLNRNYVHAFYTFLPPTLPEQKKIADCLSSIDKLIIIQTQKIEALKAHKKGLMQQLFPSSDEAGA